MPTNDDLIKSLCIIDYDQAHKAVIECLNDPRVDPNAVNKGGATALLVAVGRGDPLSVRYLLGKGADPNRIAPNGVSPLVAAITRRYLVTVTELVKGGADLFEKSLCCNGLTPDEIAHKYGCFDIESFLQAEKLRRIEQPPESHSISSTILFSSLQENGLRHRYGHKDGNQRNDEIDVANETAWPRNHI